VTTGTLKAGRDFDCETEVEEEDLTEVEAVVGFWALTVHQDWHYSLA